MEKRGFVIGLIICIVIFLTHIKIVGSAVWGDGRYYYAIAQSLAFDQDLNFANQYKYLSITEYLSDTGLLVNKYPPGTSLIWLPFLFVIGVFHCAFSYSIPCNQIAYSDFYPITSGIISILVVFIGLYFLFLTLQKYYPKNISLYASFFTLFGTNLFFYAAFDPINSHPASFFFSSLLLYILLTFSNNNLKWLISGFLFGFSILTRTIDGLLILPSLYFLNKENSLLNSKFIRGFIFLISFLSIFVIQIAFWKIIYGTLTSPYLGGAEGFSFTSPKIIGVLLNLHTGLILWTPFVFLGFLALLKIKEQFKWIFIVTILIAFYFIASWSSWDQGGSFGTRMLIPYLPFISFGYAYIFKKKKWRKWISLNSWQIIIVCGLINFLFIVIYLKSH